MLFVSRVDEDSRVIESVNLDQVESYQFNHEHVLDPKKPKEKSIKLTLFMTSGNKIEYTGAEGASLYDVMGTNRFHFHSLPNAKAQAKREARLKEEAEIQRKQYEERQKEERTKQENEKDAFV